MNENKYWIWLSKIENVGSITLQKLLEKYKSPENIWNADAQDLFNIRGIGPKISKEILNPKYREDLNKIEKYMYENKIELVHIFDSNYPKKLKQIYDKPIVLYVKGNKNILNDFSLAIIGCRENSKYGEFAVKDITNQIVKKKITTISGLARGIDSMAHKTTIENNGKTIAVIGSGIDNIYPKENIELANQIIEKGGVIISEYAIGTKTKKINFPARNRIISGLSNGVVVIEAKEKSGTMITVDFALEQGKEVFSIPGSIYNTNCNGTNLLIKQGAKLIRNIDDILEEF